jgi:hypothetical protein
MSYVFFLYGVDDLLVGTRLVETKDPQREARKLRRGHVLRVEWEEA